MGGYDELWCPECDGEGKGRHGRCRFCAGAGTLRFKTCPKPFGLGPDVLQFLWCYDLMRAHGVLPFEGGPMQQTVRFVELCRFAASCESTFRKQREKNAGRRP